ncbi:type 2 periplasmic-binding domain-containing protein [Paraglaciecola arctica]|uniref:Solute-binding protein family 3/N-terminal domain-containing protein n=1 Tax=Paraglaciecola arctica BSs20135 TaxID=493475 RepID=K6YHH9_9ALTE|nr:hypothetical protein [Paraglaciecola arctica]GAC17632.1 hypothetical protein GARC_0651 [Paraglaciecola arctica BSs20135]
MFRKNIIGVIILIFFSFPTIAKTNENNVIAPKTTTKLVSFGLNLDGFEDALLAQILSYQKADVLISRYPRWIPGVRAFQIMAKHQGIDIVWGSATKERFNTYLPVKAPIYKGLIGWRLAFVTQAKQQIFADVSTLDELRAFNPGQRLNWADYKIYKENGFTIASGSSRRALAEMLLLDRFDFFPRGVIEIEMEQREYTNMSIVLDPHLLIRYKSAFVFYVAKDNLELAKILTEGLHKAKADGSFDRLFEHHFKALFERLDLPNRRIIELNNALLPKEMLNIEEHLWISPKTLLDTIPPPRVSDHKNTGFAQ